MSIEWHPYPEKKPAFWQGATLCTKHQRKMSKLSNLKILGIFGGDEPMTIEEIEAISQLEKRIAYLEGHAKRVEGILEQQIETMERLIKVFKK